MTAAQKKAQSEEDPILESGLIFQERLFEPDEDPEGFRNKLIAISDSYGTEEHFKPFTEEEKGRFEKRIVGLDLELDKLAKEKKAFNKEIDANMKPMKIEQQTLVDNLQIGAVWTEETLYNIVDPDTGLIGIYDERGLLQRTKQMKRGRGLQKTIPLTSKPE